MASGARRQPVSCTVICLNEQDNIEACLESVKWCDEIVVVDAFSTDRTVEICRRYTQRVIQREWPGFVEQKRFALDQASHEWVFNIDADERVSPLLRSEIERELARPRADGFYVPRLVRYLGRWWRRGGWYPDYRLRLFRKSRAVWGGVDPHEKVIVQGKTAALRGPLLHYTYANIADHLRTIDNFTDVAAGELALRGRRCRWTDLVFRPLWRTFRFAVLRGGLTYGVPGVFVSLSAGFYVFAKYAKLWELKRQEGTRWGTPV